MQESQSVSGDHFSFQIRIAFYKTTVRQCVVPWFVILVCHSRIAMCHLYLIVYRMQLLDLQGAMGTKETMEPVKH